MARQEGHVGDGPFQQELKVEANLFNLECTFVSVNFESKVSIFFNVFFQPLLLIFVSL